MMDGRGDAKFVRSGPERVIGGVVDAIDGTSLGGVGGGRKGKIGIAAAFAQDRQLVVDATPFTVGPGVIECPVSVNESERDGAIGRLSQQAVAMKQRLSKPLQAFAQLPGSFAIVVKMDVNIAIAPRAEARQGVEMLGPIPLLGKEECMPRRPTVCVSKAVCKNRIPIDPCADAGPLRFGVRSAVSRLEMVGDTKKNVQRSIVALSCSFPPQLRRKQPRQPELGVSGERNHAKGT